MDIEKGRRCKITPSKERGFELDQCFDQSKLKEHGYIKDADYYFDSYSHFSIHEEMLKDSIRTKAYQNSIMKNKNLFQGKIVLDVGAGTGILSIFAAKAGAKHVYAVENANIALHARTIIESNGLSDKVTVIKGKIEEIELPVEKVDIIISEWMGYFLLYESMLDCVLFARDKYLQPDGLMFPDRAVLYLASIEDEDYRQSKIDFWDDVYGVDMNCIKKWALKEPLVDCVDSKAVNSHACPILDIDIKTVKVEDLNFSNKFELKIHRDDYVHAVIGWFDVYFSNCHIPIKLSTSPHSSNTHWKQTVFYVNDAFPVKTGDLITGSIAVKKTEKNPRDLDIKISVHITNDFGQIEQVEYYKLN